MLVPSRQPAGRRLLVPSLVFIALVVAAVGSLGAPLITSVATTFHVSLASAQWTLTITLLSGAVATPVLGRLGAGPRRRCTIIATLAIVAGGSVLVLIAHSSPRVGAVSGWQHGAAQDRYPERPPNG